MKKIVLITGATSGIGRKTAEKLAAKGFDVYIIGRSEQACRDTLEALRTIDPDNRYGYFLCDLYLQKSIRETARIIRETLPRLDVLINNAGGVHARRELTREGLEKTFALNHMAYFTLTQELLPLLLQSAPARVVNVSSGSHYKGKIEFDNLQGEKDYFVLSAYEKTKLMNVLFTKELARRYSPEQLTANCLHPGKVRTKIGTKNTNAFIGAAWNTFALLSGISEEKGAETSVFLASSDTLDKVSGRYFDESLEKAPLPDSENPELARRLWEYSEQVLASL
ncbi:MAG: SDR family NAD(P)-dependent oxidoreductase [Bacteroidia bacterium]|nr:SDR family NAD(P)-dependent oxidoreductase [Bacteroidia bacterium]